MPGRFLYAHGTCGVCGYAGGLVIASPSDPRCWPCHVWAVEILERAPAVDGGRTPARLRPEVLDLSGFDPVEEFNRHGLHGAAVDQPLVPDGSGP